jgi:hypothetical protein
MSAHLEQFGRVLSVIVEVLDAGRNLRLMDRLWCVVWFWALLDGLVDAHFCIDNIYQFLDAIFGTSHFVI